MSLLSCALFLATLALAGPTNDAPLSSAAEASRLLRANDGAGRRFDFAGTIVHEQSPISGTFHVIADGAIVLLHRFPHGEANPIVPGDIVRVQGEFLKPKGYEVQAHVARLTRIGHEAPPEPRNVTGRDIFAGKCDGLFVRIEGRVLDAHHDDIDPHFSFFFLDSGRQPLCVALPERLSLDELHALIGAHVAVRGICSRAPDIRHHKVYEIYMSVRSDLQVIAWPPWWTPARLLTLLGVLLPALVVILFWNRLLIRRSERRERKLAEERLAHMASELKVRERMRLAVELHDTLAQNLTGIALELQAARVRLRAQPDLADARLEIAGKSLESCRRDLRNVLRDLRNDALERKCMNEAIRMTLEPHVGNTRVSVRFNVPRERLSDNAAHAVICIVRELVLNALRHGNATSVCVAGLLEEDQLLFSVRDDGCGFDPDNRPGAREGHFGLVGIRERINVFAGTMDIASRPGHGTKVSVRLNLPPRKDCT